MGGHFSSMNFFSSAKVKGGFIKLTNQPSFTFGGQAIEGCSDDDSDDDEDGYDDDDEEEDGDESDEVGEDFLLFIFVHLWYFSKSIDLKATCLIVINVYEGIGWTLASLQLYYITHIRTQMSYSYLKGNTI